MSAYIIIGKHDISNAKPESEEILNSCHISPDFSAFILTSLRKTDMFLITENHFLFLSLFN